jgi:uncharacterized hydrophobic protein (TIGR00341 family)
LFAALRQSVNFGKKLELFHGSRIVSASIGGQCGYQRKPNGSKNIMPHNYVNVVVEKANVDKIISLGEREGVTLSGVSAPKGPNRTVSFLATLKVQQDLLDDLQRALGKAENWEIAICPVDAVVTKSNKEQDENEVTETREELLAQLSRNAALTPTYMILVVISAIVASLGMIGNNVAAIIGGMVIAPLLGPLLGSILGVSLGERKLILQGIMASAAGIALAIGTGLLLGLALNFDIGASELAYRSKVGFEDIALALAAGAAAALSVTAGVASVLVGVMAAVALLPPAAAIGLFLGKQSWLMAGEAALLLSVNLVALHLSGQLVFLLRGIHPRTRHRRAKVKQSIRFSLLVSGGLLITLALLVGRSFVDQLL